MLADQDGAVRNIEDRADIESLAGLHAARRALLPEYSALKALHGPFGKADWRRKQMLAAIAVRVRMNAQASQIKVTEASIDDMAHADEQYGAFIDQAIAGAVRYTELDVQISEIEERIRSRELELMAFSAEARMAR